MERQLLPLLDFVEVGEERDGDEDDDCFLAVANVKLKEVDISTCIIRDTLFSASMSYLTSRHKL